MATKFELPKDKELAKIVIDNENNRSNLNLEIGFLGKIWGHKSHAPYNIAGLVLIVLLVFGIVRSCMVSDIKDLWSIITPIITLTLGYIFGDKSRKEK